MACKKLLVIRMFLQVIQALFTGRLYVLLNHLYKHTNRKIVLKSDLQKLKNYAGLLFFLPSPVSISVIVSRKGRKEREGYLICFYHCARCEKIASSRKGGTKYAKYLLIYIFHCPTMGSPLSGVHCDLLEPEIYPLFISLISYMSSTTFSIVIFTTGICSMQTLKTVSASMSK